MLWSTVQVRRFEEQQAYKLHIQLWSNARHPGEHNCDYHKITWYVVCAANEVAWQGKLLLEHNEKTGH